MALSNLDGQKFRIVSVPATDPWCGDCDDDPPPSHHGSDTDTACLNEIGSAMIVLVGAEEDGEFAICKRHLEWMKSQRAIVS